MAIKVSLEEMNTWPVTPCMAASRLILKNIDKKTQFTAKEYLNFKGTTVYDLAFVERYKPGFVNIDFRAASVDILKTFSGLFPHPIIDNLDDIKLYNVKQLKQKQKEAHIIYKVFRHHELSQIIAGLIWCCKDNITNIEFFSIINIHFEFFEDNQDKINELKSIVSSYL